MKRALLALSLLALPAGEAAALSRMTVEAGDARCYAFVRIEDRHGIYNRDETLETEHGPVTIRYTTRGAHTLPDVVEVLSTPPDVTADPPSLELTPDAASRVCLMLFRGA